MCTWSLLSFCYDSGNRQQQQQQTLQHNNKSDNRNRIQGPLLLLMLFVMWKWARIAIDIEWHSQNNVIFLRQVAEEIAGATAAGAAATKYSLEIFKTIIEPIKTRISSGFPLK